MANSFFLKIVTPEQLFYEGEVEMVIVNEKTGEEGFMANHIWACKLLVPGTIRFKEVGANDFKSASLSEGFINVHESTLVYADKAKWKDNADGDKPNR